MRRIRPLPTLAATLSAVAALVVLAYSGQDLLHYWSAISKGYTEYARSQEGLWTLTCGLGEAVASITLAIMSARVLGTKFQRSASPA